jgi:hypothetical protein
MIKIIKIQVELLLRHNTSLANESEIQMNHDLSRYSCWIHCTLYKWELHFVHRIHVSVFPVSSCNGFRLQAASCFVERER